MCIVHPDRKVLTQYKVIFRLNLLAITISLAAQLQWILYHSENHIESNDS